MIGGRPSISLVLAVVFFVFVVITFLGSGSVRSQFSPASSPTRWISSTEKHAESDVFNSTLGVSTALKG